MEGEGGGTEDDGEDDEYQLSPSHNCRDYIPLSPQVSCLNSMFPLGRLIVQSQ